MNQVNEYNINMKIIDDHYIIKESWGMIGENNHKEHIRIFKEKEMLVKYLHDHSSQTILGQEYNEG